MFGKRFLADGSFREEARATRRLLRHDEKDGVRIIVTNPLGLLWWKYPFRNHKKLMIVDERVFLGGINLSEHNFAWRDLMLTSNCPSLVSALADDFRRTIAGVNSSRVLQTPVGELYLLDGRNSRAEYAHIFSRIARADRCVDIISPYLSHPLLGLVTRLSAEVRVRVISPARNNKDIMQQALLRATAGTNVEVLLYRPTMSHIKALLIDGTELILGSSNFDFVGYDLQQEVVLATRDEPLIDEFRTRVLAPVLNCSRPAESDPPRFYHRGGVVMALSRFYVRALSWTRR